EAARLFSRTMASVPLPGVNTACALRGPSVEDPDPRKLGCAKAAAGASAKVANTNAIGTIHCCQATGWWKAMALRWVDLRDLSGRRRTDIGFSCRLEVPGRRGVWRTNAPL